MKRKKEKTKEEKYTRCLEEKVFLKVIYWGMGGSGKTTILKTLYRLTKETKRDIVPAANLTLNTHYFDWGKFQSTKQDKVYYHVYTVAGQHRFSPLRKKIFKGTDGVIFVVDSQTKFFEDNISSLLELKSLAGDRLIKEIPLIVLLNKQDLKDIIDEDDIIHILKRENLWYEPNEKLSLWNPPIYKTSALFEDQKNIYRSFQKCTQMCLDGLRTMNIYPNPYDFRPPHPPEDLKPAVQAQRKIPKEKEEPPIKAREIENLESDRIKKIIKQYREETGRLGFWGGTITKGFKNWLKGEKVDDSHYDILFVEGYGYPDTITLPMAYFEGKGYSCKGVCGGKKGFEELNNIIPKVILLDIILPDFSGYEICKKIKSNPKWKDIPVFFFTTIFGFEVAKHLAETKADGYILKPFNFSDFDGILDLLGTR